MPTSRKVCPFSSSIFLPSWGPGCQDGSSFCPLSGSGQEKGCFGVGLGVFCVRTYPRKGCVTAEQRTRIGNGILGKMRLHLGKMRLHLCKMRPIWAIWTKSGQKCCKIGGGGEIKSSKFCPYFAIISGSACCECGLDLALECARLGKVSAVDRATA